MYRGQQIRTMSGPVQNITRPGVGGNIVAPTAHAFARGEQVYGMVPLRGTNVVQNPTQLQRMYGATCSTGGIQQNKFLSRTQCSQQISDPKRIKEAILDQRPKDKSIDPAKLKMMFDTVQRTLPEERDKLWAMRTNQPYKTIMPAQEIKKEYKTKEELVVYKVNKADKNEELFKENVAVMKSAIEKHDRELKDVYSPLKKDQYKQEFDYNHKEKYKGKYDPADFADMKEDVTNYYKQEQLEAEKGHKCIDDLIEAEVSTGFGSTSETRDSSGTTKAIQEQQSETSSESSPKSPVETTYDKYAQRQKKL